MHGTFSEGSRAISKSWLELRRPCVDLRVYPASRDKQLSRWSGIKLAVLGLVFSPLSGGLCGWQWTHPLWWFFDHFWWFSGCLKHDFWVQFQHEMEHFLPILDWYSPNGAPPPSDSPWDIAELGPVDLTGRHSKGYVLHTLCSMEWSGIFHGCGKIHLCRGRGITELSRARGITQLSLKTGRLTSVLKHWTIRENFIAISPISEGGSRSHLHLRTLLYECLPTAAQACMQ